MNALRVSLAPYSVPVRGHLMLPASATICSIAYINTRHLRRVHVAVRQHQRHIVRIHNLARDATHEARVDVMAEGEMLGKGRKGGRAHWTVWIHVLGALGRF